MNRADNVSTIVEKIFFQSDLVDENYLIAGYSGVYVYSICYDDQKRFVSFNDLFYLVQLHFGRVHQAKCTKVYASRNELLFSADCIE